MNPNHNRMKDSLKEEGRIAKKLGGRRLPRSGGLPWTPMDRKIATGLTVGGDVETGELLVEHKRVAPHVKSVSIKRDWLKKVTEGAHGTMKYPAMVLTFKDPKGHEEDWMLMPMSLAERILGKLKEEE